MQTQKVVDAQKVITEVARIVEDACRQETNPFGYTAWSHHTVCVVKHAKMLAKMLHADVEVVEIAALLHDYASIYGKEYYKEHHIHGACMAEEILQRLGYPQKKIEIVKKCIISHRGSVLIKKDSPEQCCVSSADAMAHIEHAFSIFLSQCKRKGVAVDDCIAWLKAKIERSWIKLCPQAKDIMQDKYTSLKELLELFS